MATSTRPVSCASISSTVIAARVADLADVGRACIVSTSSWPWVGP